MVTVEIKDLFKKFGENIILNKISLQCEAGKIYGIVGYNGSGKTVLFKCLCGLLLPESGDIIINGKIFTPNTAPMPKIGVIIEEPAFLKNKSAYSNLKYLFLINHSMNKNLLYETLKKVGLNPEDKKRVGKYSMGMKQRLAIAQAIMENPEILILDEPMNGLDKKGIAEIRALLKKLKEEGKTILLASHNREDITFLCDEVYEMDNGNLQKIAVK